MMRRNGEDRLRGRRPTLSEAAFGDALAHSKPGQRVPVVLVLSVPFADPLDAPYAWLDHLRRAAGAPVAICARCPALFYADHRARGYARFLEEPFEVQGLIDLVAALCPRPAMPPLPE